MKSEKSQPITPEQSLSEPERTEFEQLRDDVLVQTYLRLVNAQASAPFLNMPGIDLQAARETQSTAMSIEIKKLVEQDSDVAARAERFLSFQRRAELS
jgi:hypothetical protein